MITTAHTQYKLKSGIPVPGCTTVLGVLNKGGDALQYWSWDLGRKGIDFRRELSEAAERGSLAHYLVECKLKDEEPDWSDFSPNQLNAAEYALRQWESWAKNHELVPLAIEETMVSEKYKFGGQIDLFCSLDGVLTLLDLKTSRNIYDSHMIQVAAYRELLIENGWQVDKSIVARIPRDGEGFFEEKLVREPDKLFKIFEHALAIYQLRKELKLR